ncbi:hypothetical protein A1F94_008017 [Pyrenophora tritici-repentis]|nr:hypothetical protein A1F94_008017 [Pyrenophora tritici-repentis]KAI1539407.1 hypothetical protein PtrSN001A_004597 [Pyrenophora tritici-repentis]KAI1565175.1 hypothetical protein PtrEW4_008369 [Pyrenophora tritici-repentis]
MFSKRLEKAVNFDAAPQLNAAEAHKRSAYLLGEAVQAAKRTEEVEQERDLLEVALSLRHDQEMKLRLEFQQKMRQLSTESKQDTSTAHIDTSSTTRKRIFQDIEPSKRVSSPTCQIQRGNPDSTSRSNVADADPSSYDLN